MTARILSVSEADYRNDQIGSPGPSLNYSTAKTIIVESPLHAYHAHPRLGGQAWEPTPESEAGQAFHSLLLEGGKGLAIVEAADWRTNIAKAARDEARAAGKIPVLGIKLEEMREAVATIRDRMLKMGIRLDGRSEVPVAWEERSAHGPVLCRAKLDHLLEENGLILDVKTAGWSVTPDDCARHIYDSGYDIQFAANTSWLEKYKPELAGRAKFIFVFCERTAPFAVTPVDFSPGSGSGQFRHLGQQRWRRAVDIWAACRRDNSWPGYVTKPVPVDPPHWAFTREQELTADAEFSAQARPPLPRETEAHPDDNLF